MNHCQRHSSEQAVDQCGRCGWGYCSRCLVYSFGPNKPPLCVGCALAASGVRPNRAVVMAPKPDRKTLKLQRKAEKEAQKAAARAEKEAARVGAPPPEAPPVLPPDVPPLSPTDGMPEPRPERAPLEVEPLSAFPESGFPESAAPVFVEPPPLVAQGRLDTVPSRVMRDRTGQTRDIPVFSYDLAQPG